MLTVEIEDNDIVIRMPIANLKNAFELSPAIQNHVYPDIAHVSDLELFTQSVVEALQVEEEDGSTVIHNAFDTAFEYVIEQGLEGVEFTEGDD